MIYNEKYKCWVSKEGLVYTLNGVYNQTGYHGDGTLKIRKPYKHKISEQTKQKMSESKKGHSVSQETREKLRAQKLGSHWKLVNGKRVWEV